MQIPMLLCPAVSAEEMCRLMLSMRDAGGLRKSISTKVFGR